VIGLLADGLSGFEESAIRSEWAVEAAFVPGELSHRLLFPGLQCG